MAITALPGCVPAPPKASAPPAAPTSAPQPRPALAPAPPPPANWRDAAQTPGEWTYASNGTASGATFGNGQFIVQCDAGRTITLLRAGQPTSGPVAMSIATSAGVRPLAATSTPRGAVVTMSARDSSLDWMAFSRGRFAVIVTGQPTLYLPSWTEISRVIEDCR
ncbi:hypothetical protein A8V01_07490 [Novosphingobium guangzhouense]|uniref:Uncharacterized protein n=2 Tax=Novosphingobium guangzhouense TaxID=1850347 RepID=A0A2K2FW56_9SPHN|nr:hypothetical protein A8V01_07490 [Novosphingobium guangzhouense]